MKPDDRTDQAFAVLFGDIAPIEVSTFTSAKGDRRGMMTRVIGPDGELTVTTVFLADLDALPEYGKETL